MEYRRYLKQFLALFDRYTLGLVVVALACGYLGISTISNIARNYELQGRIDRLNQENQLLQLQNQELEYRIAYYQTDSYVDLQARDKLNMAAPGERVLVAGDKIPGEDDLLAKLKAEHAVTSELIGKSNFQQWLHFLFGDKG